CVSCGAFAACSRLRIATASESELRSGFALVSPAASGSWSGSSIAGRYPAGRVSSGPSQRGDWSVVPGLPSLGELGDIVASCRGFVKTNRRRGGWFRLGLHVLTPLAA